MDLTKDMRRRDKFNKSKKHFQSGKYQPKTKREMTGPRQRPAEDQSYSGSRRINKEIAGETLQILDDGFYNIDEKCTNISEALSTAAESTITYSPDELISIIFDVHDTEFQVALESTLDGCSRMSKEGVNVCALIFASAKNPGGGFLKGSSAQEESLACASGLYKCIRDSPMYEFNTADNNRCLYSHFMIYSPNVPVFRNNDSELLSEPYSVSFITAPAANTGVALKKGVDKPTILSIMEKRMERVLSLAVHHRNDIIILGSWGCGVFGGDIHDVGNLFHTLLTTKFKGAFKKVLFSTLSENDYDIFKSIFDV
jgi:uncharacterized protein (TIGR02452 family)